MAAWTGAARQAVNLARLSSPKTPSTAQAASLIHRRGLAGGGGNLSFIPFYFLYSLFGCWEKKKLKNVNFLKTSSDFGISFHSRTWVLFGSYVCVWWNVCLRNFRLGFWVVECDPCGIQLCALKCSMLKVPRIKLFAWPKQKLIL